MGSQMATSEFRKYFRPTWSKFNDLKAEGNYLNFEKMHMK